MENVYSYVYRQLISKLGFFHCSGCFFNLLFSFTTQAIVEGCFCIVVFSSRPVYGYLNDMTNSPHRLSQDPVVIPFLRVIYLYLWLM